MKRQQEPDQHYRGNSFRDPESKPDWPQLVRLGGDRVSLLLDELRKKLGAIDGLIEDTHFAGAATGWVLRYTLNGATLAQVEISPGKLAATLAADSKSQPLATRGAVAKFARQAIRASKTLAGR